jgi:hypothetical protein
MADDVIGEIDYFTSTTDGCPPWVITQAAGAKMKSNLVQVPVHVTIHDLRGKENSVNLDTNGFEVVKYNGCIHEEFEEGSEAQKTYYKEISDLLKRQLGASHVIVYHYTFRCRGLPLSDEQCNKTHRNPAFYPHVDLDSFAVQGVLEEQLGKEGSEKAEKNRIQAINIWRPLGTNPITDNPLTICDYFSVDVDKDIHQYTLRGTYTSTGYITSRNDQDAHIWYYLSQMRSDEIFMLKIFDSKPNVAQFAFHTAFKNGNESTLNKEQKSVELRYLVFYDE